jgi:uncharacterized protein YndB with AHSA1/START domain
MGLFRQSLPRSGRRWPHGNLRRRQRFFWTETRCTATEIKSAGTNAWRMRMTCEGEGETFRAAPLLTLTPPNRLVFTGNNPVGQGKRDAYLRCKN